MEKWKSILFVIIKFFVIKVPSTWTRTPCGPSRWQKTLVKVGFNRWSPSCFWFRVWFPFYVIAGTEAHAVQRVPMEGEPDASDFSAESSSFEFFLSNSSDSNEEKFVNVNSTLESYLLVPALRTRPTVCIDNCPHTLCILRTPKRYRYTAYRQLTTGCWG